MPIDSIFNLTQVSTGMPEWKVSVRTPNDETVADVSFPDIAAETVGTSEGFQIKLANCDTLTLRPEQNLDPLNGVNTWDLVLISRHILNLEPLNSPYKLIAADVNRSGTISSFDIVLLRRLILGTDIGFTNNTSWRFVLSDYEFEYSDNPFSQIFPENIWANPADSLPDVAFTAIKTGDVDWSATPNSSQTASDRTAWLPVFSRTVRDDDRVRVDLWSDAGAIGAAQLEFLIDREHFQYVRSTATFPEFSEDECIVEQNGRIRVILAPDEPVLNTEKQPFLQMYFRDKKAASGRSPVKGITADGAFLSRLFTPDGSAHQPLWAPKEQTGPMQVFPNPSGREGASLYTTGKSVIAVSDVHGKICWQTVTPGDKQNSLPVLPAGTYWVMSTDEEGHREAVKWVVLP